jgi:hypothetical protein
MNIFMLLSIARTGMGSFHPLVRLLLALALILIVIPPAGAWTLQRYSVTPLTPQIAPGTPVAVNYSLYFDSWMSGTTFEKDNTLLMATDLVSPQWTVRKVEEMDNQEPIVETIPVRQSSQVRLDGWTLSYSGKRYYLTVQLTGTAPSPAATSTITVLRLQEMLPGAKAVAGTLVRKEAEVIIPTPEPTLVQEPVTLDLTPSEIIEITPEPKSPEPSATPARKTTYSPGPDPLLLLGLLAGLVMASRTLR